MTIYISWNGWRYRIWSKDQISFVDYKILRKVSMALDMPCLTHGKRPGDVIITCELLEVSGRKRNSVALKQLMNEIEYALDGVGVGYPRILRLCRCVSKLLQSEFRKQEMIISFRNTSYFAGLFCKYGTMTTTLVVHHQKVFSVTI
ncbi:BnaA03g57670D [Brassica napus]|uniref:BnaA03g57670D protein n=3 Tax=Brassica TaxID=3705 RepID=A0A078JCZ7_BRANA|nr:BnaA03g57670D [Brassica napus]